jgi:hypothetical protein
MKPLQRYNIDEHGRDNPHSDGDWVRDEDVKKLEEQNEKMLVAFRVLLQDMDNVDRVCDRAGVHPFTGMRSVIQSFVNERENQ